VIVPKKITVIIPAYGKSEYLVETVQSLYANNEEGIREVIDTVVVIIDNGIDGETARLVNETIMRNKRKGWGYEIVKNGRNVGVTVSWNQGLSIAVREHRADYVMIANSDLHFGRNVLGRCVEAIDKYGLYQVSPNTWRPTGEVLPADFAQLAKSLADKPLGSKDQEIVKVKKLVGWCFMLSSECLDKVGWIDPRFDLWRGDVDYGVRLKQVGRPPVVLKSCLIHHFHSQTLRKLPKGVKAAKIAMDRRLYRRKHQPSRGAFL